MSRVALESLGCKLNQAEMEALADRLVSRGHVLTGSAGEADVYVLNTCSVTHIADRKSRQALRAARRANPHGAGDRHRLLRPPRARGVGAAGGGGCHYRQCRRCRSGWRHRG